MESSRHSPLLSFVSPEGVEPSCAIGAQVLSLPCIPFHHGDVLEGSLDWVPRLEPSNRIKKRQQELRGHVPESTAPKADVVLEASAFVGDLGIEPSWKNTCSTGTPRSIRVYSPKSPWGNTLLRSASYGSRYRRSNHPSHPIDSGIATPVASRGKEREFLPVPE